MGKIEDAIKKINTEIQKEPDNRYIALIGEHIIDCITNETAAERVLQEEKTLERALTGIENRAKQQQVKGHAVIESTVVYGWAREYFGLTAEESRESCKPSLARLSLDDF